MTKKENILACSVGKEIFLLDRKGEVEPIAERPNDISALCYYPGYGLYDAGDYKMSDIYAPGYLHNHLHFADLFRTMDSDGRITNTPLDLDEEKTEHVYQMIHVPRKGIVARCWDEQDMYCCDGTLKLLLDKKGRLVNESLTKGDLNALLRDTDEGRFIGYIPNYGVFAGEYPTDHAGCSYSTLRQFLDQNLRPKSDLRFIVETDVKPKINAMDICTIPSIGTYSLEWNGWYARNLVKIFDSRGKPINPDNTQKFGSMQITGKWHDEGILVYISAKRKILPKSVGIVNKLSHVSGLGIFGASSCGIVHLLDRRGRRVNKILTKELKNATDIVSVIDN